MHLVVWPDPVRRASSLILLTSPLLTSYKYSLVLGIGPALMHIRLEADESRADSPCRLFSFALQLSRGVPFSDVSALASGAQLVYHSARNQQSAAQTASCCHSFPCEQLTSRGTCARRSISVFNCANGHAPLVCAASPSICRIQTLAFSARSVQCAFRSARAA